MGVDVDGLIMEISKTRERLAKRIRNSPIT
jgi:hypothetical protein